MARGGKEADMYTMLHCTYEKKLQKVIIKIQKKSWSIYETSLGDIKYEFFIILFSLLLLVFEMFHKEKV